MAYLSGLPAVDLSFILVAADTPSACLPQTSTMHHPRLVPIAASLIVGVSLGIAWPESPLEESPEAIADSSDFRTDTKGSSGPAAPFDWEKFSGLSGIPLWRMLAESLPDADAALVLRMAEHLASKIAPSDGDKNELLWQALFSRWLELEPLAALAWAREKTPLNVALMSAWAAMDWKAAMAAATTDPQEWKPILHAMSGADPRLAFQTLLRLTKEGLNFSESQFSSLLTCWAAAEPQAALEDWQRQGGRSPDQLVSILAGWAKQDPAACVDWVMGMNPDREQLQSLMQGLRQASQGEDCSRVASAMAKLPRGDQVCQAYGLDIAEVFAKQDPAAAFAWAKQLFPAGAPLTEALLRMAPQVVHASPELAVAMLESTDWTIRAGQFHDSAQAILPGSDGAKHRVTGEPGGQDWEGGHSPFTIAGQVLRGLAGKDPLLAASVYEKFHTDDNETLLRGFLPDWFEQSPQAAMEWLARQPANRVSVPNLMSILSDLKLSQAALAEWAQELPPGPTQEAFVRESLRNHMEDPAQAVQNIPFTDPAARHAALDTLAREWGRVHPQQAMEHLFSEPSAHPNASQSIVEKWTTQDPTAASDWVSRQQPSVERDGAIMGMLDALTAHYHQPDFPGAFAWAMQLSTPEQRFAQAQRVLKALPGDNETVQEIRESLTSTNTFTEQQREQLLRHLSP